MQEHNVSVFALEKLQKTWLTSRRQIILHEWIVVLMAWGIPVLLVGILILNTTFPSWFKVLMMGILLIFLLCYWLLKLVAPIVEWQSPCLGMFGTPLLCHVGVGYGGRG